MGSTRGSTTYRWSTGIRHSRGRRPRHYRPARGWSHACSAFPCSATCHWAHSARSPGSLSRSTSPPPRSRASPEAALRREIAARVAALRSPSVLLRVLADVLVIDVTLIAVVAAEIVLVAAGSSLDVLVPGSANRILLRWTEVLGWWLVYVPFVTVGSLILRDIYVGRRRDLGDK